MNDRSDSPQNRPPWLQNNPPQHAQEPQPPRFDGPREQPHQQPWWRPENGAPNQPVDAPEQGSSLWGQRPAQPEQRPQQHAQPQQHQPPAPPRPPQQPQQVQQPQQFQQPQQRPDSQQGGPEWRPGLPPEAQPSASTMPPPPNEQVDLVPPTGLDQHNLVNPVKAPPKKGWRKMVHSMSGGMVNPGGSRAELEEERLLEAVRAPLRGDYRIAVMSLKGGVGKTTTTIGLGGVFAKERGDRVIAIDANPDLGTLAQRAAVPGPATIRDLLNAKDTSRYPQVRAFTNQASSRLEVIGSERDPAVSEAFSELDYRRAIDILQHHYNVILTDCGTGLMHSAMSGVLDLANSLVLVTSPALDGAQSASATLDWLSLHGYERLAANSIVVVSSSAPGKPTVDLDQLVEHFKARTRAVHVIPYDRHLAEGAVVDIELLARPTLKAYRELAATVAEDFGSWHKHAK